MTDYDANTLARKAIDLLKAMIATPSTSRDEARVADLVERFLANEGLETRRIYNNVWTFAPDYNPNRPTLMLNSHLDTVKPSPSYTFDPYTPFVADGRLYGLGSNDAGGPLVALTAAFLSLCNKPLPFNLLLALTAEEEVSGEHGMRAFLPNMQRLGVKIDMAIVGEPTSMQPAIAERGLLVFDCVAHGVTGHAARNEGVNAIYKALTDIEILRNLRFEKVSPTLGPVKISVTQIEAGRQHNVVPDECRFVVDVRTTDAYSNEQTVELIRNAIESDATPRSTRIHSSVIDESHPLVVAAKSLGLKPFVSPTTSDMALMPSIPSLKIGPGDSARSHTADEFIFVDQIVAAIDTYKSLILSIPQL